MPGKTLVFGKSIRANDLIAEGLRRKWGTDAVISVDGRDQGKARQATVDELNDPRSPTKVGVLSLRSISEALNITGGSKVIHHGLDWNPVKDEQAFGRVYRQNQAALKYYEMYIHAENTIEEHMYKLQILKKEKAAFSDDAIKYWTGRCYDLGQMGRHI